MKVVTHAAVPALAPIDMKPMQVLISIPEVGPPFSLLGFQKVGIMALETKSECLCANLQIIIRRI